MARVHADAKEQHIAGAELPQHALVVEAREAFVDHVEREVVRAVGAVRVALVVRRAVGKRVCKDGQEAEKSPHVAQVHDVTRKVAAQGAERNVSLWSDSRHERCVQAHGEQERGGVDALQQLRKLRAPRKLLRNVAVNVVA